MKKAFARILCSALLLLLAVPAAAEGVTEQQPFSLRETVIQEAQDSYYASRATAGKRSFHGTCGLMVSHQLYNLGINKRRIVFDGNDHYDYYSSQEKTTGGYYITPYSSEEYSLEQALMAVSLDGQRDVKNVLVGFQWTSTEAGAKYGHVMLINGIIGGQVYFVESFPCPLGGPEGTVISCSIQKFAKYYDKWTDFEGLIHFGTGSYHDVCPSTPTDLVIQTRFSTMLRSEPAVVGQQGCIRLRSVSAGERFRATGIYEAGRTYYYRVETNDGFGFLSASAVSVLEVNSEGVHLSDFALSRKIEPGEVPVFHGIIADSHGDLSSVEVCITNTQGQLVRRELTDTEHYGEQLSLLKDDLLFDLLEPGNYQVDVYAARSCPVVSGNSLVDRYTRALLTSRSLYIGSNPREGLEGAQLQRPHRDGWFQKYGTWYCYENGNPCSGWVSRLGVRYYLQPSGAAVTGSQTIDGKQLYFSADGALVTGWLTLDGKTGYRAEDGTALTGWQDLEGNCYYFDENGVMLTDTELERDGILYVIDKTGTANAKPIDKQEAQNG